MGRLTKRQAGRVQAALADLDRGLRYLDDPELHVVKPCRITMPRDLTFTRASDGAPFASFHKHTGSDLAGLRTARETLQSLLEASEAGLA